MNYTPKDRGRIIREAYKGLDQLADSPEQFIRIMDEYSDQENGEAIQTGFE